MKCCDTMAAFFAKGYREAFGLCDSLSEAVECPGTFLLLAALRDRRLLVWWEASEPLLFRNDPLSCPQYCPAP